MKFTILVACNTFAMHPHDNTLSVIEIIDQLNAPSFPVTVPKITFVFQSIKSDKEPTELPIECDVIHNGKMLKKASMILKYGANNKNRYILTAKNLIIDSAGTLSAILYSNGRKNSISIDVDVVKSIQPQVKS